jgi:hypothetical protein
MVFVQDSIRCLKVLIIICVLVAVKINKVQRIHFIANFVYNIVFIKDTILLKFIAEQNAVALIAVIVHPK